jgi:alkylhydroperoxidase family enzyme
MELERCLMPDDDSRRRDMTTHSRVPHAEVTGIMGAAAKRLTRKKLGLVPDPLGVMWNNTKVLRAFFGFMGKAERWRACDPQLKSFAHMAAVATVGCSFCLDLAYFMAHNDELDLDKAREVPRWRESEVFSPLERDVLEYAEAMSATPPTVTDEMSERLLSHLGPAGLVELTAIIGAANLAARTNVALGIEAQGLAASCGLPSLAVPSAA